MLFPELRDARWGHLDLGALARGSAASEGRSPHLDPSRCAEAVGAAHLERAIDHSYGGWLEDRRELWRGSYLDALGAHVHLGVDFNVPAGTRVAAEHQAVVVLVDCDVPSEGGWGTRVVLRPLHVGMPLLLYAHLDRHVRLRVGDYIGPRQTIGHVGEPPDNGGWFPHLHVQCVASDGLPEDLDGYCRASEVRRWAALCPDPLRHVSFR